MKEQHTERDVSLLVHQHLDATQRGSADAGGKGICWQLLNGFRLMRKLLEADKMDIKNKMPVMVLLILYISQVSGIKIPSPHNVEVNISDGEVTLIWDQPVDSPSDNMYNVQMAKYNGEWAEASSCTKTKETYCILNNYIHDYRVIYKVRVQTVKGIGVSEWINKKIRLNEGGLLPPSFNLWVTSSTLTIYVHEKPILKRIFPFGVTYIVTVEEIGDENKTTTDYFEEDQKTKTFTGLQWGRKYCVSVKVEATTAPSSSRVSDQQCLVLPEQEFYVIAATSLSILGVLAVVAIMSSILLCYLRRPAKTPTSLKSPISGWHPLSVSEGSMEVVTDKGWFLSSYDTGVKNSVKLPVSHTTIKEDVEEEEEDIRRTRVDSGLSMESDSDTKSVEKPPERQEDSGCGSMGDPEGSSDSPTDYPLQSDIDTGEVGKREDSGMGMSCQLDSTSLNLDGQDGEPLMKTVIVDNYRSQNPSVMQLQISDGGDTLPKIPTHSMLAKVVTGYRAGPLSCICSGSGQCSWCHKNELLSSRSDLYQKKHTFSEYSSKTHIDTVMINDLETTFLQLSDTFPLLTPLHSIKCEQDFNMNSLSLCDVQLVSE
uniref:Interleukin 10 receptor, alpha n=3 Tax=Iconisemion striatum TaxID=60296 RepID=A0A1A7WHB2_9TELE